MKSKIIFLALIVISVLFSQCRKKGKLLATYTFTTEDLNIVPYQTGETIILVDSLGDSIKIPNINRKSKLNNVYAEVSDCIECIDYYRVEENDIAGSDSDVSFHIALFFTSASTDIKDPPKYKNIKFQIHINNPPKIGFFIETYSFDSLRLSGSNERIAYIGNLELNQRLFNSVYALNCSASGIDTTKDYIKTLYYNVNQGIVGLKTKQNMVFK